MPSTHQPSAHRPAGLPTRLPTRLRRPGAAAAKTVVALVVLAGTAGGGFWLWTSSASAATDEGRRQATADTAVAVMTGFDITTLASGELAAKNQVEIRSQLDTMSTIVEIAAEGTRVKKGDQLVKLNGDQLQQQIDSQKPELVGAEADLVSAENEVKNQEDENLSSIRKAELKVELAKLALEQWEKGEVEKSRTENEQAIRRARRDLKRLKDKVEQSELLFARDFLSKDELELDRIAYDEAETKLATSLLDEKTFNDYQMPRDRKQKLSDVTEAEAELERTKRSNEIQLVSKKAMYEASKAKLKLVKDQLAKFESQLSMCILTAPGDGLVVYGSSLNGDFFWDSRGPMRIGREVAPNDLLIVLPDTSEMVSTVRVHESLAGRIKPGLTATMKIEAVGNAVFTGKVESIGVLAESNGWRDPNRREYTVKLVMDPGQDGEKLKPSMRCEAEIQLGKVEKALAVPLQAVFNDGPVRFVYTPKGGKFVKVPVNIGQRSDTFAEITAGLEAGKRVLVRNPAPAEVLDTPWNEEELKLCGLKLNDKGEPVPINPPSNKPGMPGGEAGAVIVGAPEGAPAEGTVVEVATTGAIEGAAPAPADSLVTVEVPAPDATVTEVPVTDDTETESDAATEAEPAKDATTTPAADG
jgi:HlyD family secretion protein